MANRSRLADEFERISAPPDEWETFLRTSLPDVELLRSLTYRLRLLAAGLEHEPLRVAVGQVSHWAGLTPLTPEYQDWQNARENLMRAQNEAVDLLGEQLQRLP